MQRSVHEIHNHAVPKGIDDSPYTKRMRLVIADKSTSVLLQAIYRSKAIMIQHVVLHVCISIGCAIK